VNQAFSFMFDGLRILSMDSFHVVTVKRNLSFVDGQVGVTGSPGPSVVCFGRSWTGHDEDGV